MEINNIDYEKLKGNTEGAIVAIVLTSITAIGLICKYGIDAVKEKNNK